MNESSIFILILLALGASLLSREITSWIFTPVFLSRITIPFKDFIRLPKDQFKETMISVGSAPFWLLVAILMVAVDIGAFSAIFLTALNYVLASDGHRYILDIAKLAAIFKIWYWVVRLTLLAR